MHIGFNVYHNLKMNVIMHKNAQNHVIMFIAFER